MPDVTAPVHLEKKDGIAWVTLKDPDTRNAIGPEMVGAIEETVRSIRADSAVRVMILTGEGKSFSSGGDVKGMSQLFSLPQAEQRLWAREMYRKCLSITELDIPTVAMVNGHAIGAGCALAMACDLRVAADTAKLGVGFLKIGLHPGMGTTWFLPRLVGFSKALELLWLSDIIEAAEAHRIGLVDRVVPADRLRQETETLAKRLAAGPAIPMKLVKRAVYGNAGRDLSSALDFETTAQAIVFKTEDLMEGVKAFMEKREPNFQGK